MSAEVKQSGENLKITNFDKYSNPIKVRDNLIKDIKE
jgi:hypothetical protein